MQDWTISISVGGCSRRSGGGDIARQIRMRDLLGSPVHRSLRKAVASSSATQVGLHRLYEGGP
jgi:hypothetical protein